MNEALRTGDLNEEALAFVAGKAAPPAPASPTGAAGQRPTSPPAGRGSPKPGRAAPIPNAVSKTADAPLASVGTSAITVRLPGHLPLQLLRASVERKLRREIPFTQQEIVAEALTAWLHQHGHLS